mgnify:CR=1 FL=1
MGNKFNHLSIDARLKIEGWLRVGVKPRQIAELLHCHVSTIYREMKRGTYEHLNSDYTTEIRYSPDIAETQYRLNLSAKGAQLKIGNDHRLADFIENKIIKEKYSPAAVLGEIRDQGLEFDTTICVTTLYSYIDKGIFLRLTNKNLPVKRNKKKHPKKVRACRASRGESIEHRPAEVAERLTAGHWEMDCVEGKKGTRKTLLVLTERKTRNEIIRLMNDKTAASVIKALNALEKQLGSELAQVFQTITVDNGSEFSDYEGIEKSLIHKGHKRTKVYFCHPYSAYERGSNENQNRMVRRHYPKGYDFTNTTPAEIRKLEKWINDYPREMFNYYSSAELYEACINSLMGA